MDRRHRVLGLAVLVMVGVGAGVLLTQDVVLGGRTIDEGTDSGVHDRATEVLASRAELDAFWSRHTLNRTPAPPAPDVDLEKGVVLAVTHGAHANGCVGLPRVVAVGGHVWVRFDDRGPPLSGFCSSAVTTPYKLVYVEDRQPVVRVR